MLKTIGFGMLTVLALALPAQAEVFKDKGGVAVCLPGSSDEVMKRPDGSSLRKTSGQCGSVTDMAAPFDHQKWSCTGYVELGTDSKVVGYRGQCEVISLKGDRAAFWYVFDPTKLGTWGYIPSSGTGAYAGITGGGTWKIKAPFPGGGQINEYVGTWETSAATASK
jgi:hypothetical protein